MPWYLYTPIIPPGNICNPNNYTLVGVVPPACPSPKVHLCAIQAMDNMGSPIISLTLACEIGTALQNSVESTNVLLKP